MAKIQSMIKNQLESVRKKPSFVGTPLLMIKNEPQMVENKPMMVENSQKIQPIMWEQPNIIKLPSENKFVALNVVRDGKMMGITSENSFECAKCDNMFENITDLANHFTNMHAQNGTNEVMKSENQNSERTNPGCTMQKVPNENVCFGVNLEKAFKCTKCNSKFSRMTDLTKHNITMHSQDKTNVVMGIGKSNL